MASRAAFFVCAALVVHSHAHANTLRGARASLDTMMQPEAVAATLKNVEDKWKEQAAAFISCSNATQGEDCSGAPSEFAKSCAVVVGAVVQGSNGDKLVAKDYMATVCSESLLKGWHQQHCMGLKAALNIAMTADSYQNRESFTSNKMCTKFWGEFVEEEKKRFVREEAERKAAEKKAAEEAEKREKEAAEKAQKAKEEAARLAKKAKEDAEKKAVEEAARKKIEEATRVKAEAQAKAAESAAKFAKKKAEAAEFAKRAEQKMEEAAEAERVHKSALANLTAHVNTTVAAAVAVKPQEAVPAVASVAAVAAVVNSTVAETQLKPQVVAVAKPAAKKEEKAAKKEEKVVTASATKPSTVKAVSAAANKK